MLLAVFPLILAIVGALAYALSSNAKVSELGRLAFASGLIALAFALASHVVRIG